VFFYLDIVMKPYRKNVGIVVFNSKGEVLTGERVTFPNSWQFPQGGVDEGEDIQFAAERELYEEVGIKNPQFVYEYPDWIHYDFPSDLNIPGLKKYRGQTQKWFLYYWDFPIDKCNLHVHEQEFSKVRFQSLESTIESIVEFKRDVYIQIVRKFKPIIEEFLRKQS
jgi:putative (di)nucleoside polyphosphate hydrolase